MSARAPLIVLDDDPTGTQSVIAAPVLLAWDEAAIAGAAAASPPAVHLITNTRAYAPAEAEEITARTASQARAAAPASRMVLRGDSTLRGHVLEEYRGVCGDRLGRRPPVLLLVLALPSAGRVTRDGTHWLERQRERLPLHETEYASDGVFSYTSSRLIEWAHERSGGYFPAGSGREVPLRDIRGKGASAVADAILAAAREGPAVCAPDAETLKDLETIAEGLRRAEEAGAAVVVRSAPAFVGVLGCNLASSPIAVPEPDRPGVLLVCGSYVQGTNRQLADLTRRRGIDPVEVDVARMLVGGGSAEANRAAAAVRRRLDEEGRAIVATPRERPAELRTLPAGRRVASALAEVVGSIAPPPGSVVAKGGITSLVTLREGLGVTAAHAVGPIAPGAALWRVRVRGAATNYVVVPGNVGEADLLTRIMDRLGGRPEPRADLVH